MNAVTSFPVPVITWHRRTGVVDGMVYSTRESTSSSTTPRVSYYVIDTGAPAAV